MEKVTNYFIGVKKELDRVKWPTKKDMLKYSVTTILFIIFFGMFFYGLDFVFAYIKSLLG